jgi:acetoin:2,6-dichlorophenolindophenol oxidoreductase subunit beta
MTAVGERAQTESMKSASAMTSALECSMAADEKVIVLGEDVADPIGGVFKVTKGLSTKFGTDRVRATPISEQAIIGTAIGLSMVGYRPVAEIMFFDFITVAMDQIVNHAAKLRYMSGGATPAPITVRTTVGGSRFGAQHAQSLEAWFMHTPGIKVVMPSGPRDAKGLLISCVFDDDPCLYVEHMGLAFSSSEDVPVDDFRIPLGKANILKAGSDITIISYGPMVRPSLDAAAMLMEQGIRCEVIDLRTLTPLDTETIFESVTKTRRAVVVHEATTFCGPGAEISSQIHEQLFGELLAPVLRLGAEYTPVPFSTALSGYPTRDSIAGAVLSAVRP